MRVLEIIFAILFLPIALILGLIIGLKDFYDSFDRAFWKTVNKGERQ